MSEVLKNIREFMEKEGILFFLDKRDNLDYGKIFGSQNP
jgi:hypothetical protein